MSVKRERKKEALKPGIVLLYNWALEEAWMPWNRHPDAQFPRVREKSPLRDMIMATGVPQIGLHWQYRGRTNDKVGDNITEGRVTSIDKDSGMILTDAGEILLRG